MSALIGWGWPGAAAKPHYFFGESISLCRELAILRLRLVVARDGVFDRPRPDLVPPIQARINEVEGVLRSNSRCLRCGTTLTDPESVRLGIGPKCRAWDARIREDRR